MYAENWRIAFLNLGIELITIAVRTLMLHFEYLVYGKQIKHIRLVVANKVYDKILSSDNKQVSQMTKDKMLNIVLNNLENLSEFPDSVASFFAYSILVIISLTSIFTANFFAGVLVTLLGIVNFIAYFLFNKKLGRVMLKRFEKKDVILNQFSKVIDGKPVINELGGRERYLDNALKSVADFSDEYARYYKIYSSKTNLWYIFLECYCVWNNCLFVIHCITGYTFNGKLPYCCAVFNHLH